MGKEELVFDELISKIKNFELEDGSLPKMEELNAIVDKIVDYDDWSNQQEILNLKIKELHSVLNELSEDTTKHALSEWKLNESHKKLEQESSKLKMIMAEMEQTNNNLIAATFRERDAQKKLKETTDELDKKKDSIIETQNRRIADSINYAKGIQTSINPSELDIQKFLPNSFMYYKPKDVVSGDFPWFYTKGDFVYIAAVDCTGHGVPGAMMSVIGSLLLVNIIDREKEYTPGLLLDMLHKRVVRTLKQNAEDNNSSDGMDVGVCRVNTKTNELVYAGAHRLLALNIADKEELVEIKGDKYPIGGMQYEKKRKPFVNHTVQLKKGDAFYVFSDGFSDQPGGERGKKYTSKRFFRLLEEHKSKKIDSFSTVVKDDFETWMEGHKQLDDILLIGVEI